MEVNAYRLNLDTFESLSFLYNFFFFSGVLYIGVLPLLGFDATDPDLKTSSRRSLHLFSSVKPFHIGGRIIYCCFVIAAQITRYFAGCSSSFCQQCNRHSHIIPNILVLGPLRRCDDPVLTRTSLRAFLFQGRPFSLSHLCRTIEIMSGNIYSCDLSTIIMYISDITVSQVFIT